MNLSQRSAIHRNQAYCYSISLQRGVGSLSDSQTFARCKNYPATSCQLTTPSMPRSTPIWRRYGMKDVSSPKFPLCFYLYIFLNARHGLYSTMVLRKIGALSETFLCGIVLYALMLARVLSSLSYASTFSQGLCPLERTELHYFRTWTSNHARFDIWGKKFEIVEPELIWFLRSCPLSLCLPKKAKPKPSDILS